MKRGRLPPRQAELAEEDSSEEAPSEEELAPAEKRRAGGGRMVPQHGSSDSGDSQSDSEEDGSSGSDSEVRPCRRRCRRQRYCLVLHLGIDLSRATAAYHPAASFAACIEAMLD